MYVGVCTSIYVCFFTCVYVYVGVCRCMYVRVLCVSENGLRMLSIQELIAHM